MEKQNIFGLSTDKIDSFCVNNNIKKYISTIIQKWIYQKYEFDTNKMTDIKLDDRLKINDIFNFLSLAIVDVQIDNDDETTKFLLKTYDGNFIETCIMKFNYGYSVCISTQIGCNMGCKFCASGLLKKIRNLETNEIVEQVVIANKYLITNKKKLLSNIVVMGVGEPLDNYDNLKNALLILQNPKGINIGNRKVTVSTCGRIDKIIQFANDFKQTNLAISLHAPNDKIRNSIMPINKVYNIASLFKTLKIYQKITNRRITFEYIMLDNINDSIANAMELAKNIKDFDCLLNLIPYNNIKEHNYTKSTHMQDFIDTLKKQKILYTIRLERGKNIQSACGQLRAKMYKKDE